MHKVQIVMLAEHGDHLRRLVLAHQAMIDQHAGQPVADRFMDQQRGDRRIDAARQAAQHAAIANLRADLFDHLGAVGRHRPIALDADDLVDEIGEQPAAIGRVHHFGVEHCGVIFARLIGSDGKGGVLRGGDDFKTVRQLRHPVAMAHPDRIAAAGFPDAFEQF